MIRTTEIIVKKSLTFAHVNDVQIRSYCTEFSNWEQSTGLDYLKQKLN